MASLCIAALPALTFGQADPYRSQPYTWKSVVMKGGGFIDGVMFNPTQPGLAYCRTDVGGAYKWDNQAKIWVQLLNWVADDNLEGTESVATDPIDPQRVYIAAGMHQTDQAAILRSMDQGKTFQTVNVPFRMGGNENGRGVGERLAIDPNANDILYFGSRAAGLWTSKDAALTWNKVDNFPSATSPAAPAATGRGRGGGSGVGLSFVVFDPSTGTRGKATQTIYVGSTDAGASHLFRSTDAGQTWQPVPGQPADLMAVHAGFDTQGIMYAVYGNSPGPGGTTVGAVWKFNPKDGAWTDITPVKGPDRIPGGYGGLGIDRQHPDTLVVASLNRKDTKPGSEDDDRIYRTSTAPWTAQQIVEAFPKDQAPRFLLRNRDSIYSPAFADRVEHRGIDEVLTAHRCPRKNPFVERLIGSIACMKAEAQRLGPAQENEGPTAAMRREMGRRKCGVSEMNRIPRPPAHLSR